MKTDFLKLMVLPMVAFSLASAAAVTTSTAKKKPNGYGNY
jgi:hypothetical protein